jgi:hypothetical protein
MGPENSIHMHRQALLMGCDVLEFGTSFWITSVLSIRFDLNFTDMIP